MRILCLAIAALAVTTALPTQGSALSWPKAILAVANVDDATTAANGNEVAPPCVYKPCVHAGVPTATADVKCLPPPYGCGFLWEGYGRVHLRVENLETGEWCEGYFPMLDCNIRHGGMTRFTLTAVSSGSESVISRSCCSL